jgi:hypothetical protein
LKEDAFRDSSAFEIPKSDLYFLSYVLTTVSRGESQIGRAIGIATRFLKIKPYLHYLRNTLELSL